MLSLLERIPMSRIELLLFLRRRITIARELAQLETMSQLVMEPS